MKPERVSSRRLIVTLCIAVLVVLAGCSSATDVMSGADDDESEASTSEAGSTDELTEGEWQPFEFDRPATYTFDVYMEDEGAGTLVWDVTDVTDDGATVSVDYDVGETSYESTVTGSQSDIQGQLMVTPAGPFLLLSVFSPTMTYYESQTLTVGNEWSVSSPEGSMRTAVIGTDSYGGIECYASEMAVDGEIVHESCLSPDLGLAPYTAYFEDGETVVSMELVDFSAS